MRRFAALISLVAALGSVHSQVPPAVVGPKLGKPIEFELPAPPDDAVLAGNGRFICFTCPAAKRFAIVDVTTAAIAKTIPMTEDDAVVAGTLSRLYVLSQRTRTIQGYKLDSLEADGKSKAFPKGMPAEKFAKAVSAPGTNGAIFLYFPKGKVTGGLLPAGVPTFGPINWKHFGPNNAWGPAELRVSHAGTLLIGYGGGYAGMESAVIRNNRAEIWDDKFTGAVEWANPSADGQFIYTAGGHLARNMTFAGGEKKGAPYTFPSVDPGFYFTVPSNAALKDIRGDGDAVRRNARGSDQLPGPILYSSDSQKIAALNVPKPGSCTRSSPGKTDLLLPRRQNVGHGRRRGGEDRPFRIVGRQGRTGQDRRRLLAGGVRAAGVGPAKQSVYLCPRRAFQKRWRGRENRPG